MRLKPAERRAIIINAAVSAILQHMNPFVTIDMIARRCEVETSEATIRRYFPSASDLRVAAAQANPIVKEMMEERGLEHDVQAKTATV